MDDLMNWFFLIPLAFFGYFAWRYLKHGSLAGAMLGGRITRTVGEVELASGGLYSTVLRIGILETDEPGAPQVAMTVVSKAALSASMTPFRLSAAQARRLITLLEQAVAR